MSFAPYLNFNGTCKEAMTFYTRVFGGTLSIQHLRDMPDPPITRIFFIVLPTPKTD